MGDDMIDWTRVRELRDEVGEEDFTEVVDLFLEEVEEAIDALPGLGDPAGLTQALHFLKGSALSLGFSAFSELCTAGERRCSTGQAGDIDLDALIDGYRVSKALFLREMDSRIAA